MDNKNQLSMEKRVVLFLEKTNQPVSTQEIADVFGFKISTVRKIIQSIKRKQPLNEKKIDGIKFYTRSDVAIPFGFNPVQPRATRVQVTKQTWWSCLPSH